MSSKSARPSDRSTAAKRPAPAPTPPPTTDGWTAQLVGGALCLDFANTVPTYLADEDSFVDHLPDYASLLAWCVQVDLLDAATIVRLRQAATRRPGDAERVLRDARTLRLAIYEAFAAAANDQPADDATLATLSRFHAAAAQHERLVHRSNDDDHPHDTYVLEHAADDDAALDAMLWPIARSAVDLLLSGRHARVRVCEAAAQEACTWLFVDESKNHSRRWCSMRDCGNRAKVRRHYQRSKRDAS
jgi:predicted RNA-binding Zn ribbon-like protein